MRRMGRNTRTAMVKACGFVAALWGVSGTARAVDTAHLYIGTDGGSFHADANWSPNSEPDTDDTATIFGNASGPRIVPLYSTDATIGNLVLSSLFGNGGRCQTFDAHLTVNTTTTIDGAGQSAGKEVFMRVDFPTFGSDIAFQSKNVEIKNGGELFGNYSSSWSRVTNTLHVGTGSFLGGEGLIEIGNTAGSLLNNDGTIRPRFGALEVRALGPAQLDLDGASDNGNVNVTSGTTTLKLTGQFTDSFGGTMTIGEGNKVTHANQLTMGDEELFDNFGTLNLNGGAVGIFNSGDSAEFGSSTQALSIFQAQVHVTGYGIISGDMHFEPRAEVTVNDGILVETGPAKYRGGTYTGNGTIRQNGGATFSNENTTIDVNIYDWDGANDASTLVDGDITLTINSKRIETQPLFGTNNTFNGTLSVEGGHVNVNTDIPWTMSGTLFLETGTKASPASIGGSAKMIVQEDAIGTGQIYVHNFARISAPLEMRSGPGNKLGLILVHTDGELDLDGETTLAGGTIQSYDLLNIQGIVHQNGNVLVTADSAVAVGTYDMDGAGNTEFTINPGVGLFVHSNHIDVGNESFGGTININGGRLDIINQPHEWELLGGKINMTNPGASIPKITGDPLRLASNAFTGTIKAVGDSEIDAPLKIASSGGVIDVQSGNLKIAAALTSEPGAILTKTGGGTLVISPASIQTHGAGSSINVNAGVLQIFSSVNSGGANLTVRAKSFSTVQFFFNQQLTSQQVKAIEVSNSALVTLAANGGGVLATTDLTVAPNGDLDLVNNDLIKRSTAGTRDADLATMTAYIKSARSNGTWLGGGVTSTAARNDLNQITTLAAVINDKGGGNPLFAAFDGLPVDSNAILVKYTYYGDVDLSGDVNADDYQKLDIGFANQLTGFANGDVNYSGGAPDADDYQLADLAFALQGAPLRGGPVSAVPEPGSLGLLAVAAGGFCLRRRRSVSR